MAESSERRPERIFRFKHFSVRHEQSALKVGTDAVVLGAAMTVPSATGSPRFPDDGKPQLSGKIAGVEGPVLHFLDIGTGCGVIALMAAQRCPEAEIVGIDIDGPSVLEASENFAASPWPGRLKAIECRLQDFRPEVAFDLIFSNPPYYDSSLLNPDHRESSARHTLDLSYRDICAFASCALTSSGRLSLVLPAEAETVLRRCAASFSLKLDRIVRISTVCGKSPRRIIAEFIRQGSGHAALREEALCLYSSGITRSAEYAALCSEFYL